MQTRLAQASADEAVASALYDPHTQACSGDYTGYIEDFIGTAKIPIGLIGPLLVRGPHCSGAKWVPLATSEAALVASYQRGACALSKAGGVTSILLAESVVRSPCFVFPRAEQAGLFVAWLTTSFESIKAAADGTSRYAKLLDLRFTVEGNNAYVSFEYSCGDA
ncbi:MAG: 3-hydroxy-3-methylglutaryl-CoA reductase, partial [Planctomycetota bacterium]